MPKDKILNSTKQSSQTKDPLEKEQQEEEKIMSPLDNPDDQTPGEQARITFVKERFKELEEERDRGYQWFGLTQGQFGGKNKFLNVTQYINESEKRLNGSIEKPSYKDDWQSNIFDNVTREKTISIVARLAAQRMKAKFFNDTGLDPTLAIIISNLYEKAGRGKLGQGRDDEFTVRSMWEAVTKGTVVREESYRLGKRTIKIGKPDKKTNKVKTKTLYEWEDVSSEIIPLEEFYPGDVKQANIQKMPDCARAQDLKYDTFLQKYADFDEAKNVRPNRSDNTASNKTTYQVGEDTKGKMVRVIRYYNRITDSFDIVANDRLLTPLGQALPYEHKQLPFNVGRFELLSNTFFYGMSLPFKLAAMQDMTNSVWNLSLDQLIIALKTPIFNASGADLDVDWLYPGAVIDLPRSADINSVREFKKDLNAFSASQSALGVIKGRLDSSAGSGSEASGVAGAGRGRTAEEVATAREAALDIVGLFLRFMEWAEEDRAEQRVQIMLEKYVKPRKQDGKMRKLIIDGVPLINGTYGKMFVNITNDPRSQDQLNQANLATKEMSQVADVKPQALRDFKYLIKIVPDSSIKDTEFRRKQEALKFFGISTQAPEIFNVGDAALEVAVSHGKDPNKALAQQKKKGPEDEVAELLKAGGGEAGGMAKGGGVRVPSDSEVANSQPDSFIQGQS